MDNDRAIYDMLVDGLRLVVSPYEVQCEVLPVYAHVPDEVLLAVENIYAPQLLKAGINNEAQALNDFEAYLNTFKSKEDY